MASHLEMIKQNPIVESRAALSPSSKFCLILRAPASESLNLALCNDLVDKQKNATYHVRMEEKTSSVSEYGGGSPITPGPVG